MIQRIQSLYLLAIAICSFALFYTPIGIGDITYTNAQTDQVEVRWDSIKNLTNTSKDNEAIFLFIGLIFGIFLLSLVTIFLFKNRKVQMLLGNINKLLILVLAAGGLLYPERVIATMYPDTTIKIGYSIGAFVPFVMLILIFLAHYAIKKDEAMVRAADRLR